MSSSTFNPHLFRPFRVWPAEASHQAGLVDGVQSVQAFQTQNVHTATGWPSPINRPASGDAGCIGCGERILFESCIKLRKRVSSSCRICASDSSEVCFVSGIITAFIGSLVAISGIFTRNQARTRLYMEGFGCGMVILGVLVVFISLKLRASKDFELNQFSNLFHHYNPRQANPANYKQSLFQQGHYLVSIETGRANYLPQESQRVAPIEHKLPLVTTTLAASHRMPPSGSIRLTSSSLIDLASGSNGGGGGGGQRRQPQGNRPGQCDTEEDSISLASLAAINQGQSWTPCLAQNLDSGQADASYGHERATIEAALSIVLTTATIAGFRPASRRASANSLKHETSPGVHFVCCLHHTVQHKLQARKWINCLRVAEPQIDAANNTKC